MRSTIRKLAVLLFVFTLVTLACANLTLPANPSPPITGTAIPELPALPSGQTPGINYLDYQDQLTTLYQVANPGVVAIRVLSESGNGLGSGFVIDDNGYIVTNYHVVQDATELEVAFASGYKTRGVIRGIDNDSDIAVIKVEAPAEELHPLLLGDSDLVDVGQVVAAIGNPHGLGGSMSVGIVSSKGRTLDSLRQAPGGGLFTSGDIIQTDAAINPGNSGGPLLNMQGEVIGINVAIQSNSFDLTGQPVNTGIGFAISINIVKRVVPHLIADGYYNYPYLGIRSLSEITLFQQETLGLPVSTGIYITEITPDGPADQAGLQAGTVSTNTPGLFAGGDLIIAIDGKPVRDFGEMISYLFNQKSPGDVIRVTVLRDGREMDFDLTLGKRP
ncbi:MAG: trypsin-like peptidase domain-containing protein [Anaerolineales bacterium]|nr:trypsin-like peptidase domain-containing protein [Anaerolineales bacterium]